MINLTTADTALRDVYLGVISNLLQMEGDIFFRKLKQSTAGVYGKEIQCLARREDVITLRSKVETMITSFTISDKAMRAARNSPGAFVNVLNDEVEEMVKETQQEMAHCLYGVESRRPLRTRMKFTSLKQLFNKNNNLYGVQGDKILGRGKVVRVGETVNKLNFNKIAYEIVGHNEDINLIICSKDFMYAYKDWLIRHNQNVEIIEEGHFRGIKFDGIEMYANKNVDCVYGFNMNDFTFHQLCDWEWLENEEGKIIKAVDNRPYYQATLVKYGNIVCVNPEKQIKIIYKNT